VSRQGGASRVQKPRSTVIMSSRGDRARLSAGAYYEGENEYDSVPSEEDESSEEVRSLSRAGVLRWLC
jgi:hypothetical protein